MKSFFEKERNIALYPYSPSSKGLLTNISEIYPQFKVMHIISPLGLGLCGHEITYVNSIGSFNLKVEDDIDNCFDDFDTLFIDYAKDNVTANYYNYIMMIKAIERKKDVFCNMTLSKSDKELALKMSRVHDVEFIYAPDVFDNNILLAKSNRIYPISKPVIFIGGLVEEADNDEVFLNTCTFLKKNNYNVLGVSNDKRYNFLGIDSFPELVLSDSVPNSDKVYYLNDYLLKRQETDIDCFVLQIPGAFMRYNDVITNDFGILPFIISQAVQPNIFICCAMFGFYNSEFVNAINTDFYYKYGYMIDYIHLSTNMLMIADTYESGQKTYLRVREHMYQKCISENKFPDLYNLLSYKHQEVVFNNIINEFK